MSIELFRPSFRIDECLVNIRECLENGWTGLGFKTLEVEKAWSDYSGLPYSHFLSSNTVGLHLALYMFKTKHNWVDGDEIISTAFTFVSTNHAIMYCNMQPIFADIDQYLCLDPKKIEDKITSKTRAVLYVGIGGNTGQYEEVVALCKKYNLILILDAAHMAGSRLNGRHVGREADCTVFSFQAVKNLATADSGMICFKEADDDARARKLTWLGINKDTYERTVSQGSYKWMYDVEEVGFKYHGNSIMAAIALVSLRYLDQDNAYRRQLANWYIEGLEGVKDIELVPTAPECESSRHLFQIRVQNREKVLLGLNNSEIHPGVHYRDNTEYRMYHYGKNTCPNVHKASREVISLPMHMNLTKDSVQHISNSLRNILREK